MAKRSNKAHIISTQLSNALLNSLVDFAERKAQSQEGVFALNPINPVRVLVAYSGGRDSAALLDVAAKLWHRPMQTEIQWVKAAYIHHGLSKNADQWEEHCKAFCDKRRIEFFSEHVFVNKALGLGVEAAAREARYRALLKIAKLEGADLILTAHHMDDRLETFLIEWIRGAGPEGLTSMVKNRLVQSGETIEILRPWLAIEREEINSYVARTHLPYVEDESNTDTAYLRNLIRNEIFPTIDSVRSGWRKAAHRSVELVAESAKTIDKISQNDLKTVLSENGHLLLHPFLKLEPNRQALVFRSWLSQEKLKLPSQKKLTDTLRQINESQRDSKLLIKFENRLLHRFKDELFFKQLELKTRATSQSVSIEWKGEAQIGFSPWAGVLKFEKCKKNEDGFDAEELKKGRLKIQSRQGGEKIKLHPLRPSRHLKHLYQSAKIPAFSRQNLPLVWLNGELIYAAGLGAEVRSLADKELVKDRIRLVWVPDKTLLDD